MYDPRQRLWLSLNSMVDGTHAHGLMHNQSHHSNYRPHWGWGWLKRWDWVDSKLEQDVDFKTWKIKKSKISSWSQKITVRWWRLFVYYIILLIYLTQSNIIINVYQAITNLTPGDRRGGTLYLGHPGRWFGRCNAQWFSEQRAGLETLQEKSWTFFMYCNLYSETPVLARKARNGKHLWGMYVYVYVYL